MTQFCVLGVCYTKSVCLKRIEVHIPSDARNSGPATSPLRVWKWIQRGHTKRCMIIWLAFRHWKHFFTQKYESYYKSLTIWNTYMIIRSIPRGMEAVLTISNTNDATALRTELYLQDHTGKNHLQVNNRTDLCGDINCWRQHDGQLEDYW